MVCLAMEKQGMKYINIHRLTELPDLSGLAPFKAVLSIEEPVAEERQWEISTWLVEMGCRYVISRGEGCESWTASVRRANLEAFDIGGMNPSDFVMATDHRHESLKSVFWYAKKIAKHPEVDLGECVLLHLGGGDRSSEYQSIYHRA